MAYVVQRRSGFTGYFRDPVNGKRRSAGVFGSSKAALTAATKAENGVQVPPPRQRSQGVASYLTLEEHFRSWVPRAQEELLNSTLKTYIRAFDRWVLPALGDRDVASLGRADVEEVLREARRGGTSPATLKNIKAAIGRALRPLVPEILPANPAHGIKIITPPSKKFDLIEPRELKKILAALPNEGARLMVEFLISTGCRFGEATEIRRFDINLRNREIDVMRRVTEVNDPEMGRFKVVTGTKAGIGHGRHVGVAKSFLDRLIVWCDTHDIGPGDLVFPDHLINDRRRRRRSVDLQGPGETFQSGNKTYRHGTAYGYSGGKCRCQECRDALLEYRRTRHDRTPQPRNSSGHLANATWNAIWKDTLREADLDWEPRTHDLRHAYATYLLEGGIDINEVRENMGHRNLSTTLIYLHRVESQRSKAREVIQGILAD